jgi:iron complex outermembrane receptor protein
MDIGRTSVELFLSGRNLTDDEQRYHTTFIKDLAPQLGRTVEAGARVYF